MARRHAGAGLLLLAREARRAARVQHLFGLTFDIGEKILLGADLARRALRHGIAGWRRRHAAFRRPSLRPPFGQAAVQDRRALAPALEAPPPPPPRRAVGRAVVIDHQPAGPREP